MEAMRACGLSAIAAREHAHHVPERNRLHRRMVEEQRNIVDGLKAEHECLPKDRECDDGEENDARTDPLPRRKLRKTSLGHTERESAGE